MMGLNRFLWAAATCLGVAALLLACGPTQPAATEPPAPGTPVPGTESPEPETATPAAPADSPLPTPARDTRLTPEATRLPELVPGLTRQPPVTGEVPAGLLDAILADLAGRLGAGVDEIEVVRGESVVWRDGSLGCPEPGMMYTQALVDGYWVVLEHGGQSYDYRAMEGGFFKLCESAPPVAPADSSLQSLVAQAQADLSRRLSVDVEQIEVVEIKSVVWPDASLGCPQPDMLYKQVPQDGALILLRVEGELYEYHSGGGRDPFLCEPTPSAPKPTLPQIDIVPTSGSEDD